MDFINPTDIGFTLIYEEDCSYLYIRNNILLQIKDGGVFYIYPFIDSSIKYPGYVGSIKTLEDLENILKWTCYEKH
jgi:hypothetical protein